MVAIELRADCWWRLCVARAAGVRDQPDGRGASPGAVFGGPREVRPRRCDDAGQHPAVDADIHRQLSADSELAKAIAVSARASRMRSGGAARPRRVAIDPARILSGVLEPRWKVRHQPAIPQARAILAIAPTPRTPPGSARPASLPRCAAPDASVASTGSPPTLSSAYASRNCASPNSSRRRSARRRPYWRCSTPPRRRDDRNRPRPRNSGRPRPRRHYQLSRPGRSDRRRILAEIGDEARPLHRRRALKADAGSAPSPGRRARSLPSPIDGSRTIALPPSAGSGPTYASINPGPAASTTDTAETTATATPPPCATSSTRCSASCITASRAAKPSTRSRLPDNPAQRRTGRCLTVSGIGGLWIRCSGGRCSGHLNLGVVVARVVQFLGGRVAGQRAYAPWFSASTSRIRSWPRWSASFNSAVMKKWVLI